LATNITKRASKDSWSDEEFEIDSQEEQKLLLSDESVED